MRQRIVEFRVRVAVPAGVTVADLREYVEDAVASWKGGLRPPGAYGAGDDGDPLFYLDGDSVRVTRLHRRRGA